MIDRAGMNLHRLFPIERTGSIKRYHGFTFDPGVAVVAVASAAMCGDVSRYRERSRTLLEEEMKKSEKERSPRRGGGKKEGKGGGGDRGNVEKERGTIPTRNRKGGVTNG